MFFRKRQKDDGDAQFGQLDELVGASGDADGSPNPVEDGIRRALQRDDLTDEDRAEFEAALKRLQQQKTPE
jgi:hypothetical protein